MTGIRKPPLRDERGQVIVLAAVLIPVFLLMTALVVDAGNWYTHKRSLQNRADAGALAAGLEYISQLNNCRTTPGTTGTTIANIAKRYAGTNESVGTTYNKIINTQSNITVAINSTSPTASDWTDGGSPCTDHNPGDAISPNGGLWTDVKVQESNVGTLFRSFGISLPRIAAQARVEVKQILGVRKKGLPFINETGDQIECVWAQFVRARDGSTTGFTVSPSNPIQLTGGPYTWTGNVSNLQFTNAHDDIAIRYWAGSRNGSAPCSFAAATKGPLPHTFNSDLVPVQIDWINVYDTGAAPAAQTPPKLRRFSLTSNSCGGGPGFVYTANTDPTVQCQIGFAAEVDTGVNAVSGQITINPIGTGVDPVTRPFTSTGGLTTVTGTITVLPNETRTPSTFSQDYDQVGPTWFSVSWRQTTGRIGTGGQGNCVSGGSNCSGTFQGETVSGVGGNIQQQLYTADPLSSVPLVGTSIGGPRSYGALTSTGPFSISFTHTAVDKEHIVLIRDSVQSSGNRTRAVYCGNSPGQGAAAMENAIRNGCAKDLVQNTRQDSCSPAPLPSANPWDCTQLEQGNKTSIAKGLEDRFTCTTNNWVTGGDLPYDEDPRWAYIILTGYGRIFPANNNDWLPIEGLLRVYVTGWDKNGGGGGPANCAENDPPPRGYDSQGAQLWGHLVSPITIDPSVIVGDPECNLTVQNPQCSPRLVR